MISANYRDKVVDHIADAQAKGAKVLVSGRIYKRKGCFHEPTVLVNVHHDMKIMTEETFGTAIPLMTYDLFDEAIRLTNNSIYSLGACLYTGDAPSSRRFFEDVKAGTI